MHYWIPAAQQHNDTTPNNGNSSRSTVKQPADSCDYISFKAPLRPRTPEYSLQSWQSRVFEEEWKRDPGKEATLP